MHEFRFLLGLETVDFNTTLEYLDKFTVFRICATVCLKVYKIFEKKGIWIYIGFSEEVFEINNIPGKKYILKSASHALLGSA